MINPTRRLFGYLLLIVYFSAALNMCSSYFYFNVLGIKKQLFRTSTLGLSSADIYEKKALELTGSEIITKTELKIALALQEKDFEKEKQKLESDWNLKNQKCEAYYLDKLAEISQREIIEQFFKQIIALFKDKNETIIEAVSALEPANVRKNFIENCNKEFPTMTIVNSALTSSEKLREAAWKCIGLDDNVRWPKLPSNLLYSIISSSVHELGMKKVYLRSDLDPTLKIFYENLSAKYERKIAEIDAELIALAKDEGVE